MDKVKKGMVFGVFDGLHDGHLFFLNAAKALCEELVVVVAKETAVRTLKGRAPHYSLPLRMQALSSIPGIHIVEGDEEMGGWGALRAHTPDMVFLGHDQQSLAVELERLEIPHTFLPAHRPDEFKSSIIRRTV